MANAALIKYVSQSKLAGKKDEDIFRELIKVGWQQIDIEEVLGQKLSEPILISEKLAKKPRKKQRKVRGSLMPYDQH